MIDPRGHTVVSWTDQMALDLSQYGLVEKLDDPSLWQDWAERVVSISDISKLSPPDPRQYDDWSVWADRFNMIVRT